MKDLVDLAQKVAATLTERKQTIAIASKTLIGRIMLLATACGRIGPNFQNGTAATK